MPPQTHAAVRGSGSLHMGEKRQARRRPRRETPVRHAAPAGEPDWLGLDWDDDDLLVPTLWIVAREDDPDDLEGLIDL